MQPRILVIKLSSLGDFIQALGAMAAIRRHHAGDHVTLLTTKPYRALAERSGLFDEIWIDPRASALRPDRWLPLIKRLREGGFARIYDLQWADRTGAYFRALKKPRPEWVGIVEGCSHRLAEPKARRHIRDRQAALLELAGIETVGPPDLRFLTADISHFGIERPYALLVPGSSPAHRRKRWPAARFGAVARALAEQGIAPVLIAGSAERAEAEAIAAACPEARDVDTGLEEIVELAKGACVAVSNDTGPAFLIEAGGCPLVLLYGAGSDSVKLAPRGQAVRVLRGAEVDDIDEAAVLAAVHEIMRGASADGRAKA